MNSEFAGKLATAAIWGYAFGTALDASAGLSTAGLVWVWIIFWAAAALAWHLTRARQ